MRRFLMLSAVGMLVGVVGLQSAQADVIFRAASSQSEAGFKPMTSANGEFFVASKDLFNGNDVLATASGRGLALQISEDIANSVRDLNRLAVFVDGALVDAPEFQLANGQLVLNTSRQVGQHLGNVLGRTNASADAPIFSVRASQSSIKSGEQFSVDVFLSNVTDLALYQVRVIATGARTGNIPMSDIQISKERSDYIFDDLSQVMDAADMNGARMGAFLMTGSVNFDQPRYLGTYTFQAPAGVSDTFYVNVEVGPESLLTDETSQELAFQIDRPAVVQAGVQRSLGVRSTRTSK